jgi:ABC-2 type transport system ATP-binding protein
MITLEHLTKRYGNKVAVDDLNLHIDAGELFAFLGPNGAGKTTTIKLMCGLLFPTTGSVRIGGFDLQEHGRQARQLLSYVPDQPFVYDKLTGREFLQFIGDMYGLTPQRCRQRIEAMISAFRLAEFVDDLTQNYSHGMRQRTVFAGALLHEPRILIVDEPTVGLDPPSVRLLKELLRAETERGVTVFLSTHSLDVAEQLAHRIGIVDHGRLIGCGTLDCLRAQASVDGSLEDVFMTLVSEEKVLPSEAQTAGLDAALRAGRDDSGESL